MEKSTALSVSARLRLAFLPPEARPATTNLLVNATYLTMQTDRDRNVRKSSQAVEVIPYRTGCELRRQGPARANFIPPRGKVADMSTPSRLRAAFAFANSPRAWGAMVTLTFPIQPERPKLHFRRWRNRMRDVLDKRTQWGWIMEFQQRGVIHFHVFIERARLDELRFLWPHWIQRIRRHGRDTDLVRGRFEYLCVTRWVDGLPSRDQKADAFNWGGICELFRSPEGAARYTAKEASKREQKCLPEGVVSAGRWWWLSPAGRPQTEEPFYVPDFGLPPFRRVFSKRDMAAAWINATGQGCHGAASGEAQARTTGINATGQGCHGAASGEAQGEIEQLPAIGRAYDRTSRP